jgi:SAM-dependent methyltransferase
MTRIHEIPRVSSVVRGLRNKARAPLPIFRLLNRAKEQFECPVCKYAGPFADLHGFAGNRKHAMCPQCGALERHRLQYLVASDVMAHTNVLSMNMLHFAPEAFFRKMFSGRFGSYETADLYMKGVNYKADLLNLPFKDASYDIVFASHVLEHIADDTKAIQEISRVLKPNGVAILPVPIVCEKTIEYPSANPNEAGHVRAPGLDYFEKYKQFFNKIQVYASDCFPEKYQLFIYEDRTVWPTKECPLRPPMQGKRHSDFVPVCLKH